MGGKDIFFAAFAIFVGRGRGHPRRKGFCTEGGGTQGKSIRGENIKSLGILPVGGGGQRPRKIPG